jgi:hypothetical protein
MPAAGFGRERLDAALSARDTRWLTRLRAYSLQSAADRSGQPSLRLTKSATHWPCNAGRVPWGTSIVRLGADAHAVLDGVCVRVEVFEHFLKQRKCNLAVQERRVRQPERMAETEPRTLTQTVGLVDALTLRY